MTFFLEQVLGIFAESPTAWPARLQITILVVVWLQARGDRGSHSVHSDGAIVRLGTKTSEISNVGIRPAGSTFAWLPTNGRGKESPEHTETQHDAMRIQVNFAVATTAYIFLVGTTLRECWPICNSQSTLQDRRVARLCEGGFVRCLGRLAEVQASQVCRQGRAVLEDIWACQHVVHTCGSKSQAYSTLVSHDVLSVPCGYAWLAEVPCPARSSALTNRQENTH